MPNKKSLAKYVKLALKLGADDARPILTDTIVTAAWVRLKCHYGCTGYGRRLTCPPYSPSPEKTAQVLENYQIALLVHGDDHTDITNIVTAIERQAFLDGYYKAFALGSGPCRLCSECNLLENECRHAEKARPAMEACGIDVFQTVRNNGLSIEVVKNHNCKQNYYGVVLVA